MKVDCEDYSERWADSLSIRFRLPLGTDYSKTDDSGDGSEFAPGNLTADEARFTRSSASSLMALRNLPVTVPIVLFTPVLVLGGSDPNSLDKQEGDPFEALGRELARHHANISHVPYVPSIGFTDTHMAFARESEAVITVTCEPNHSLKKQSVRSQFDFAQRALKVHVSNAEMPGEGESVLVQCATVDARLPAPFAFANVIETSFYNKHAATELAGAILGRSD